MVFKSKTSLYIALFVAFIDFMGLGLIYPLFASLLFDRSLGMLPWETSQEARGIWLGVLIALMPLAQFFSAPIWGILSDNKGRKSPLQLSITIGLLGYLIALLGVFLNVIWLLLASRLVIGFASGNTSIVQATVADLSTKEQKTQHFGLYSMALGAGFTLGPFFGGSLAYFGNEIPFLFAFVLMLINFLFVIFFFKESHHQTMAKQINWKIGIEHISKAFRLHGCRTILLCSFLHNFGWSYFFEFAPVYLISHYHFSQLQLGLFYGFAGAFYAVSTGFLIQLFAKRFKQETLFFGGNLLAALVILSLPFIPSSLWIWPLLFLICYFVAFVTPSSTTLISNSAHTDDQGEALGILSSVNAAALVLSPLFSGTFVGNYPSLPMHVGGLTLLAVACIMLAVFGNKLFFNYQTQSIEETNERRG